MSPKPEPMYKYLPVAYFFLNFYLAGVFVLEIEVNYRTWLLIGAEEFPLYHQALTTLLIPVLLLPMGLAFVLSWFLGLKYPSPKDRFLFLTHALLLTVFLIVTLTAMVPLHNQLSQSFDAEIIRQLIFRSALMRLPLQLAMVAVNLYLMFRFCSSQTQHP